MKGFSRMRKDIGVLTVGSLVLVGLLALVPLTASPAGQKGNETKGKFYFKQNCKSCHVKDAQGGEITPLSKDAGTVAGLLRQRQAYEGYGNTYKVFDARAIERRLDVPLQPRSRFAAAGNLRKVILSGSDRRERGAP